MSDIRRAGTVLALLLLAGALADAQSLKGVRKDFAEIGDRVIPATVTIGAVGALRPSSSGVIVHSEGYVLSDSDATVLIVRDEKGRPKMDPDGKPIRRHTVDAMIRLPDQQILRGIVIRRDPDTDTTLLKIIDPVKGKLPVVRIGSSDELDVGSFTVVAGNTFGAGQESEASLSMGAVAALVRHKAERAGKYETLYTSATVVTGSNGGPCVDSEGRLVGIISTFVTDPKSPFRALGKITPIDKIRPRYVGVEGYEKVFPDPKTLPPRSREAGIIEKAFAIIARHAHPSIVSLDVKRAADAQTVTKTSRPRPGPDGKVRMVEIELPRYPGPYSGVVLTTDGQILTCTANLWEFAKIESITVHLPDGRTLPAQVLGRDRFRRVALLSVDAKDLVPLPRATEEDFRVGRLALACGNPFGETREEAPLLTFGVISNLHRLSAEMDAVQSDAGMNDAMVGGALLTLDGKLLGLNLLVNPERFGRNSGIGFAIPMTALAKSLPLLRRGQDVVPGYMGTKILPGAGGVGIVFHDPAPDGPSAKAGLETGDLLLEADGRKAEEFPTPQDFINYVRSKPPGKKLHLKVKRGGKTEELEITLGSPPDD